MLQRLYLSHGHKHTVMQLSCYNIYIISQVTMFILKSWPQAHGDAAVMLQYLYYKSSYNVYIEVMATSTR